ncbi:MAG: hypothetical protein HC942_03320 [Microcoleus sp. SU_5_6]|nr:hypothetical protein [Microcoleus sp. SU_5_6]NJL67587.1 hypothetical protein [Microcoleus sp. SM1_3_4]
MSIGESNFFLSLSGGRGRGGEGENSQFPIPNPQLSTIDCQLSTNFYLG